MARRTSADAYEFLRQELLHGALMAGDRLRVADLNERYRLGLSPIREALMRLTSEGLVSWESYRGARVPDDNLDEFRDMIRTRREIERLCLAKAIDRGDANWEAEIVRSYHVMSRTPFPDPTDSRETTANWERCHRQFHYSLVAACGSDWLLQFWNTLADQSERYRKAAVVPGRSRQNPPARRPTRSRNDHGSGHQPRRCRRNRFDGCASDQDRKSDLQAPQTQTRTGIGTGMTA